MRVLAGFLLIGALLGGGCEAPGSERSQADSHSSRVAVPESRSSQDVSTLLQPPPGLPTEGTSVFLASELRARDVWVVGLGTVDRLLRDDTKAPRHQRFVVRCEPGLTVLIAHNIDVAPRVPLKRGDRIWFRGQYVWSDQGGVVHWTHRDKRDKNAGGWIVWKGQNFR